jgi:hypothetical protein
VTDRPAWNTLLAPLPADAIPKREPVAPPEVLALREGAAIAGWDHVVLHLSDPCHGLRTIIVVIDETGRVISAGDSTFWRSAGDPPTVRHESLGGRFEADGTFRGTYWVSLGLDPGIDEDEADLAPAELTRLESTRREPTPDEIAGLRAIVDEMLRRQARRS